MINKSFLKWAGGKSKLLDKILPEIGEVTGRYIEPFLGSGVVAFNVEAKKYLLSDINPDLISVYKYLCEWGESFIDLCKYQFDFYGLSVDQFYEARARFNSTKDPLEKAALFIFLNRHAFNGLCRYNSKGGFNVPCAKYKQVSFPEEAMLSFIKRCDKYAFTCIGFSDVFSLLRKDDVVYCDPPYVPLSITASFTQYAVKDFDLQLHTTLAELASASMCKVIISNHDTEFTRELYKNSDKQYSFDVSRHVGGLSTSRRKAGELLVVYNAK